MRGDARKPCGAEKGQSTPIQRAFAKRGEGSKLQTQNCNADPTGESYQVSEHQTQEKCFGPYLQLLQKPQEPKF